MITASVTSAEPALLDAQAVADRLDCSASTVTRLTKAGILPPAVKLGRLRRWPKAAIDDWIAARCPQVSLQDPTRTSSN